MAVSKMEKLTILSAAEQKEQVLQSIQGLQAVEVKNFSHSTVDEAYLNKNFPSLHLEENEIKTKQYQVMLHEIQESLLFLTRYAEKSKAKAFNRQVRTLDSLESSFDEKKISGYLLELQRLKNEFISIDEERKKLLEAEAFLARWRYLDIHPKSADSSMTNVVLGTINDGNQGLLEDSLKELPSVYKEEIYHSPHHIYYCFIAMKDETAILEEVLRRVSFSPLHYDFELSPKEAYEENKVKLEQLVLKEKEVRKQLGKFQQYKAELFLAEEMVFAYLNREEAKKLLMSTEYFFLLQGWIPVDEKQALEVALAKNGLKEELYIEFEVPSSEEIQQDIPVHLKNNKIVAPFEMLTEMYSLPKYEEVDPTPWMTPFYMVFFGMMVADIGYGLLMLTATVLARKLLVLPKGLKRFADFFYILSFPTILWGLVYGSFFGAETPSTIAGISLPFPLLSTTEDVNTILILSVVFGFIQLIVGLMINGVQLVKKKSYLTSVGESFGWQGLLIGILIAVLGKLLLNNSGLFWVGVILACLSAFSILLVPVLQTKSKVKGFAKGMYNLYGLTGYIGDLVSYTRLMALGISGGSIAAAFNLLVGFMPPLARYSFGLLLIVVLHALNIFLSLLGAYVHGARLQYVEFFGKFYNGGGRAFRPLKTEEKYINIEKNDIGGSK